MDLISYNYITRSFSIKNSSSRCAGSAAIIGAGVGKLIGGHTISGAVGAGIGSRVGSNYDKDLNDGYTHEEAKKRQLIRAGIKGAAISGGINLTKQLVSNGIKWDKLNKGKLLGAALSGGSGATLGAGIQMEDKNRKNKGSDLN